ncbi:MAG: IS3 family transposase [Anaerolineae bacterium]|nr:IS3 family transposase [Anaerolineae bacterium]
MMQFQGQASVKELCQWTDVPKSSHYYKAHPGPRGMKPTTYTLKQDQLIPNERVVDEIRTILGQDYCVYGYHVMADALNVLGYLINDKKVYRLMKENHLLLGKVIRTKGKRTWVKFRRIKAVRPMEYLCLDITYIWVHGENRWYYQLSIMDVYSRMILVWIFQKSVRQNDVIALMRHLDLKFGLKGVMIRNDNGSQFIANRVRQTLEALEANQEFTHVATPEENAYIESFHSIQERELLDRFEFASYYDARQHIEKYMHWYNHIRIHGSLNKRTPAEKWAQGWACSPVKQPFQAAWPGQSRPADAFEKYIVNQPHDSGLDGPGQVAYLRLTGEHAARGLVLNRFEKSVQKIGG